MPGNLFDVFVVGSTDSSVAGETRLAAALSAKHNLPLATVAKAISAKNLRAGQNLDHVQAQALVRHLQSIGAVTVIKSALAHAQGDALALGQASRAPIPQPPPMPPATANRPQTAIPAPGSRRPSAAPTQGSGFGMPAIAAISSGDPFAPVSPGLAPASAKAGASDPFQPRHLATPAIASAGRPRQGGTPSPPSQAHPSDAGFGLDVSSGPKLELARAERGSSEIDLSAIHKRPSTSAASLRELGMRSDSGVAVDEDPKNLNLVRCVQHGLHYDKTKASGCRKCMSSAHEVASKIEAQADGFHVGDFRRKPAQRAFYGLLFSLVLGFLPAVYYCFGPGTMEVRRLRVEQELLSRQPGSEEIMRQFDAFDAQVGQAHNRSTRNTAIVWVAVASVAMLGWYKIT